MMLFLDTILLAWKSLTRNLLRSGVACGSDCLARVAHLLCRHARTAPHAGTEHGQEEAA